MLEIKTSDPVDVGELPYREALVLRVIQDAVEDEDPAIRLKASALIFDIIQEKEFEPPAPARLVNQHGDEV